MLKNDGSSKQPVTEDGQGFNAFTDGINAPERVLPQEFTGHFWPAMCFSCERKRHEALHTFSVRSMNDHTAPRPNLRTCKVCVKYAMRLSEVRKQLKNLERFFQPSRLHR